MIFFFDCLDYFAKIFLFFSTSVCVYQPPREVEWSACSASTKDQVRTKALALVKSRLLDGKCPEEKVISKACKNDKNNKGIAI